MPNKLNCQGCIHYGICEYAPNPDTIEKCPYFNQKKERICKMKTFDPVGLIILVVIFGVFVASLIPLAKVDWTPKEKIVTVEKEVVKVVPSPPPVIKISYDQWKALNKNILKQEYIWWGERTRMEMIIKNFNEEGRWYFEKAVKEVESEGIR